MALEKGTTCREKAVSQGPCSFCPIPPALASGRPGVPGNVPGAKSSCELGIWSLRLLDLPNCEVIRPESRELHVPSETDKEAPGL